MYSVGTGFEELRLKKFENLPGHENYVFAAMGQTSFIYDTVVFSSNAPPRDCVRIRHRIYCTPEIRHELTAVVRVAFERVSDSKYTSENTSGISVHLNIWTTSPVRIMHSDLTVRLVYSHWTICVRRSRVLLFPLKYFSATRRIQ